MPASCINEYNECNKGYLIPHEGTTSRLIVIPMYICLVISYDIDLVFCLCIYTFNKFNQSINQSHTLSTPDKVNTPGTDINADINEKEGTEMVQP